MDTHHPHPHPRHPLRAIRFSFAVLASAFAGGMLCGLYAPAAGVLVMVGLLCVCAWTLGREWMDARGEGKVDA